MKYLLDTNVCIDAIRKNQTVLKHIKENIDINFLSISSITLAELEYGIENSSQKEKNKLALCNFISTFSIIPFDVESAHIYGILASILETKGTPIETFDTLLASQALSHNFIFVTNNTKEFIRIPNLEIENWAI